jgi:hypothetical protein
MKKEKKNRFTLCCRDAIRETIENNNPHNYEVDFNQNINPPNSKLDINEIAMIGSELVVIEMVEKAYRAQIG